VAPTGKEFWLLWQKMRSTLTADKKLAQTFAQLLNSKALVISAKVQVFSFTHSAGVAWRTGASHQNLRVSTRTVETSMPLTRIQMKARHASSITTGKRFVTILKFWREMVWNVSRAVNARAPAARKISCLKCRTASIFMSITTMKLRKLWRKWLYIRWTRKRLGLPGHCLIHTTLQTLLL